MGADLAKQTRVLQGHICAQGGHVLSTIQDLRSATQASPLRKAYVLAPHDTSSDEAGLDITGVDSPIIWVSEWWIERCLHRKTLTDPENDVCSRPLGRSPIPGSFMMTRWLRWPKLTASGFDQLTVCSTGFTGVDLLHLSKVIQLMGRSLCSYWMHTN